MTSTKGNLMSVPFHGPKDKDGTNEENGTVQVTIDIADNGFVVTTNGEEDVVQNVYLFDGQGPTGPKAMIQDLIQALGLIGKVKVQ